MKKSKTINLNAFQLHALFNEDERQGFVILLNNSFCFSCKEERTISNIDEILLYDLNDIEIGGTCPICGGKMGRYMEYGEDQDFSRRADLFRKQIK